MNNNEEFIIYPCDETDIKEYDSPEEAEKRIRQYAIKCDLEEARKKKEDIKIAILGSTAIVAFIALVFYLCFTFIS